jgi:gluconolactonase
MTPGRLAAGNHAQSGKRDMIINTGAVNMSVEHTARTSADRVISCGAGGLLLDHEPDWHNASINFALQNVSIVTDAGSVALG